MDEHHQAGVSKDGEDEVETRGRRKGLDPESQRIFEEGYERYRKAMERLAEL